MRFARLFFLPFSLVASFATTGRAILVDWAPTYQHVGIHNISFISVPEINPAWSAVGSCIVATALILRHSAKFRK